MRMGKPQNIRLQSHGPPLATRPPKDQNFHKKERNFFSVKLPKLDLLVIAATITLTNSVKNLIQIKEQITRSF